ncbi:MAG: hypothetical protein JXQ75_00185 [Phycisphaerae bacterium]|nr:hypothetical protein [Phycisphaerae bacterium]
MKHPILTEAVSVWTGCFVGEEMIDRRRVITALIAALAPTAGLYADMMPAFPVAAAPQPAVAARDATSLHLHGSCGAPVECTTVPPDLGYVTFLLPADAGAEPIISSPQPIQLLSRERGSLDLCLYALFSLGLCKSVPWVKKLHFGGIPDWYHHGAPAQIGPSRAIEPNCLCSAAVCFVQPDCRAEDFIPQYRLGTIASLWRDSQRTPAVRASRAPPLHC